MRSIHSGFLNKQPGCDGAQAATLVDVDGLGSIPWPWLPRRASASSRGCAGRRGPPCATGGARSQAHAWLRAGPPDKPLDEFARGGRAVRTRARGALLCGLPFLKGI